MRILFFGAGPLGSVYAHLLNERGGDVTVLARGERYDWLKGNGLVLRNEITGQMDSSYVKVVSELKPNDGYDLVIVLLAGFSVSNIKIFSINFFFSNN